MAVTMEAIAGGEDGDQDDGQDEGGDGLEELGETHDDVVDPAAGVTGDGPEDHAEHEGGTTVETAPTRSETQAP